MHKHKSYYTKYPVQIMTDVIKTGTYIFTNN